MELSSRAKLLTVFYESRKLGRELIRREIMHSLILLLKEQGYSFPRYNFRNFLGPFSNYLQEDLDLFVATNFLKRSEGSMTYGIDVEGMRYVEEMVPRRQRNIIRSRLARILKLKEEELLEKAYFILASKKV
jgi:uncharacterized protein YwgA